MDTNMNIIQAHLFHKIGNVCYKVQTLGPLISHYGDFTALPTTIHLACVCVCVCFIRQRVLVLHLKLVSILDLY
jgi:hypothetical protein